MLSYFPLSTKIMLNCDHPTVHSWYLGRPDRWAQLINVTAQRHRAAGREIASVAPFNEPDFGWGQYTGYDGKSQFLQICNELRKNSQFDAVRLSGGNTLNCDEALNWYGYLRSRLDEGNTQQLAGVSQSQKGNSSGASREDSKSAGIKEEKQPGTQEQASVEQPASDKTESQTQKQATMAKSYPFIQSAAKVNSLVVEENGGFYMVETMADNVEEFVMKAKQTESTLAAKLTEVEQLNATIEQMKKDHAEALANLKAEHEKEVSSLKDAHKKESEDLTAKLNEAQKSIEQKDAEIKELSETAQLEPTPQDPPKDNNGGQESGQFHVQSVCGENMSWGEKAEARRKRDVEISKAR
jgi:hypothetical protein